MTSAVGDARYVYGIARTGGVIAFAGVNDNNDKELWMVYLMSEGPCNKITNVFVDGEEQEIERNSSGVITFPSGDYAGHITLYEEFHATGRIDTTGATALRNACEEWTNEHRLVGVSYVIARLRQGDNGAPFDSPPEISCVMEGRKITWPGQTAPTFTENPVAIAYDFLKTFRGIPEDKIDAASFQSAIPVCDALVNVDRPTSAYRDWPSTEKRYTAGGVLMAGDDINTSQKGIEFAFQGTIAEYDGKFFVDVGRNKSPTIHIGEADIVELVSMQNMPDISDRTNACTLTLTQSKFHDFNEYAVPEIVDEEQLKRDDEKLARDLGRVFMVNSPAQAGRNLSTALRRSRAVMRADFRLSSGQNAKWLALKPTDIVTLTYLPQGFENQRFRVLGVIINEDWSVSVSLEENTDDVFNDNPVLGPIKGRSLRAPRLNQAPERIAADAVRVSIVPRVSSDRTYHWKATVQVPNSALGFFARFEMGEGDDKIELNDNTLGASLQFDINAPQENIKVTVWRVSRTGLRGPERTVKASPSYTDITIPAARKISWDPTATRLQIELSDPLTRSIAGAEFRASVANLGTSTALAAITDATWASASRLDAVAVLLQPGQNSIYNVQFSKAGRYRIFARYVDSVGQLGPISEMGEVALAPPANDISNTTGSPDWDGTLNHLFKFDPGTFGSQTPLLPDRAGSPATLTRGEWETIPETDLPDKWQYRYRVQGGTYGNWVDVDKNASSITITGLTNGTEYEVEFRRVDDGVPSSANTLTFTPKSPGRVPPKPTLSSTSVGATTANFRSVITGNIEAGNEITEHQYQIGSGSWTSIQQSASKDVSFTLTGLTQNAVISVKTRARNATGTSPNSNTVSVTPSTGQKFGGWTRANSTETEAAFTTITDPDNMQDGTFAYVNSPNYWKNRRETISWLLYTQWTDGNTQHQIRNATYAWYNHRSRTRTSANADWGDWSSWGSASAYEITDCDSVVVSTPPRLIQPSTVKNGFSISGLQVWVHRSRWFVYNVRDNGGNWTRQVALKHYRDGGWDKRYMYYRTAASAGASATVSGRPILMVNGKSPNEIELTGRVDSDGGSTVSSWQYKFSSSPAGLDSNPWVEVPDATGNNMSFILSNLAPGTEYFAQIRAINDVGNSTASFKESGYTVPTTIPSKPTLKMTASKVNPTITFDAEVEDDGGAPVKRFQLKYGEASQDALDPDGNPVMGVDQEEIDVATWIDIPESAGSVISYVLEGLNPITAYWGVVRAINESGESEQSDIVEAYVPAVVPYKPTLTLTASQIDPEIQVNAVSANTGGEDITEWQVRYIANVPGGPDVDEAAWQTVSGASGLAMATTLTGLQENSSYTVEVRARNSVGYSAISASNTTQIGDLPSVPPKPALTLSQVPNQSAIGISASVPSDNGSSISSWEWRFATTANGLSSATWTTIPNATGIAIGGANAVVVTDSSIQQSTLYYVQVRAVNAKGASEASSGQSVTTDNVPEVPIDLTLAVTATYTTNNMNITLTATADDDGNAISAWNYRTATTEGGLATASWTNISGASGENMTTTLNNQPRRDHWFQVRARNSIGWSLVNPTGSVPGVIAPSKPSLTAARDSIDTHSKINLTASVTDNGGASIDGWQYKISKTSAGLATATWVDIDIESNSITNFAIENLELNTTYYFTVRASNGTQYSPQADTATASTTPAQAPIKPTFTSTTIYGVRIDLTATTASNRGADVTSWEYRYATTATAVQSATWNTATGEVGNTGRIVVRGLTRSTTYYFQVRCSNSVGTSDLSDVQNFTTNTLAALPDTPTGGSAVASGCAVQLGGATTENNGSNITRWEYRRATTANGLSSATWTTARSAKNVILSGDSMGYFYDATQTTSTTYYYQVRAVNATGASEPSSTYTVTTGQALFPLIFLLKFGNRDTISEAGLIDRGTGSSRYYIYSYYTVNFRSYYNVFGSSNGNITTLNGNVYRTNWRRDFNSSTNDTLLNDNGFSVYTSSSGFSNYRFYTRDQTYPNTVRDFSEPYFNSQLGLPNLSIGGSGLRTVTVDSNNSDWNGNTPYRLDYQRFGRSIVTNRQFVNNIFTVTIPPGTTRDYRFRLRLEDGTVGPWSQYIRLPGSLSDPGGASGLSGPPPADDVPPLDQSPLSNEPAPSYQVEEGNTNAVLNWQKPADIRPTDWPFGTIERYNQAFDSSGSTYYESELIDLERSRLGKMTVSYEMFAPDNSDNAVGEEIVDIALMHGTVANNLTTVALTKDTPYSLTTRYMKVRVHLRKTRNRALKDISAVFTQ